MTKKVATHEKVKVEAGVRKVNKNTLLCVNPSCKFLVKLKHAIFFFAFLPFVKLIKLYIVVFRELSLGCDFLFDYVETHR